MTTKSKLCGVSLLFLSTIGLLCSIQLTRIHYLTHTDPAYEAVCAVSDKINCETVALSSYSILWGIPISVWGLLSYLALFLLVAVPTLRKKLFGEKPPLGLMFFSALGFSFFSAYLAFISITRIASICLFCNALYVVNLLFLILSILCLRQFRINPLKALFQDIRSFFSRPLAASLTLILALLVVLVILVFYPTYWSEESKIPPETTPVVQTGFTPEGHPWIGARNPIISIMEYTDYECPFCRKSHRMTRQLVERHPTKIRLVHRHFPLDQACNPSITRPFHQRACELSRFAFCAGEQKKFWKANDAIFFALDYVRAKDIVLSDLISELRLDLKKMKACMHSSRANEEIQTDLQAGHALNIRGTPTYFIGGKSFIGTVPQEAIENYLANLD